MNHLWLELFLSIAAFVIIVLAGVLPRILTLSPELPQPRASLVLLRELVWPSLVLVALTPSRVRIQLRMRARAWVRSLPKGRSRVKPKLTAWCTWQCEAAYDLWKSAEMSHAPHAPLKTHVKEVVGPKLDKLFPGRKKHHGDPSSEMTQEAQASMTLGPTQDPNTYPPVSTVDGQAPQGWQQNGTSAQQPPMVTVSGWGASSRV